MRDYLEANGVKKAVVIGGGFIGLELAENLFDRGISVTVVEVASQILSGVLDGEMAGYVQRHLQQKGIRVLTAPRPRPLWAMARWRAYRQTPACCPAALWWCPRASGPTPPFWRAPASRWKRAPLWWTNVSPPAWRTSTPPGTALW